MESRHFIIVWDLSIPVQSSYIPALGRISGTHFQACQHDMSGAQKSTLGWIPNLLMFNQLVVVIQFSHNPEETKNSGNKGLILWCIKKSRTQEEKQIYCANSPELVSRKQMHAEICIG